MAIVSHNITRERLSTALPPTARVRRPGERRSSSRSATRALDVLEYFAATRRPAKAIDISKALGLHPSTTNQLLKTMVDSAHLVFDGRTKAYFPSPRLAGFGAWLARGYFGGDALRDLVDEIQARTGEIVTLSTPNDLFMQLLDRAGGGPSGDGTERGLRVPLFGSALGGAYLATLDDREVAALADRARLATAEIPQVLAGIARIRAQGYAFGGISPDGGTWSVAVALPPSAFQVPLVLAFGGPAERVDAHRDEFLGWMQDAIARQLGPREG